jgi:hypothetical protein
MNENLGFHVYIFTYNGSGASTGRKLCRDGEQVNNADDNSGSCTTMRNTTSKLANYITWTTGTKARIGAGKYGLKGLVPEELSLSQVLSITNILRGYAGLEAMS